MITDGYSGMDLREAEKGRINTDGVFRRMVETGHCPLRDYDYANLARTYGIGTGSMIALIRNRGLDARLEEETMTRHTKIDHEKAMAMYRAGALDLDIGIAFGCTDSAISAWRARNGLPANGRKQKLPEHISCRESKIPEQAPQRTDAEQAAMEAMVARLAAKEAEPAYEPYGDELEARAEQLTVNEDFEEAVTEAESKRKPATINQEWEKAVDEMAASNKPMPKLNILGHPFPEIQPPSFDDLLEEVDRLKRENNILRAVCFGAGVRGLDEWLAEALA